MADSARIDLSSEATDHPQAAGTEEVVFSVDDLSVYYGEFRAVREVTIDVHKHEITAFIGPSGCGKTTVLRCLNRMNDFIESARVEGKVDYHGINLYDRRSQRDRGAEAHRDGVPEAEPVPEERSTTMWPTGLGWPGCASGPSSTPWSSVRCAGLRCGTRSRTG